MYQKILVPLDGSKLAESVLPHIRTFVSECGVKEVVFIYVVQPALIPLQTNDEPEQGKSSYSEAVRYLEDLVVRTGLDIAKVRLEVLMGKPAETISAYAERTKPDLILICSHGRSGVRRLVWGSVAESILRSSGIPVLVVRPRW